MNKKAIDLIENAYFTKASFLDLGNLALTEIPDELFRLKYLKGLNLGTQYYDQGAWKSSLNKGTQNVIKWIPWRIKRLENLHYLSLYATYTGDIHSLQELPQLKHLDLSYNYQIRDFASLRFLRKLQYLSLNTTRISDISILKASKSLSLLDVSYNKLRSLQNLQSFKKLSKLFLANTLEDYIDLKPICHLNLSQLDLGANNLVNLDCLDTLQLQYLNLFDLNLQDISFLEKQQNLRKLVLWKNKLTNIQTLQYIQTLEDINLRDNHIENISGLLRLPALKRLDIAQNPIQDVSKLKTLDKIELLH